MPSTPNADPRKGIQQIRLGHQPTREYAGLASTDHPMLIWHASGHLSAANNYMLRISGIVGQLAVLVVLDQDLTVINPARLSQVRMGMTIVGGKVVYAR